MNFLQTQLPARLASFVLTLTLLVGGTGGMVRASAAPPEAEPKSKEKKPEVLNKPAPENVADLKALQDEVKKILKKAMPATVGIQIGPGSGSGVIINKDGLVLTAGHVSGNPGQSCTLIFPDGKRVKGKTLGWNQRMDSGMIQITEKGPWPYMPVGDSSKLKRGQWVVAMGHPGGYKPGRTPVVRLGRVLQLRKDIIQTDCALVGGDSGGPLFDLDGNVIGINSKISWDITANMHVPIDSFREDWDRLVKGDKWGGLFDFGGARKPAAGSAYLGVAFDPDSDDLKVNEVRKDTPAEKAGFMVGDVLLSVDGMKLKTRKELAEALGKKKPGDEVTIEVQRGEKSLKLTSKLSKRPAD